MAKVLFIAPSSPEHRTTGGFKHIPFGILYLSSSLKQKGHEVALLDFTNEQVKYKMNNVDFEYKKHGEKQIKEMISEFNPDLVGIPVHYSGRFRAAIEICRTIKKDYPQIPIVFGGIHPTIFPREILEEYECVDFILQGESENTLTELTDTVIKKVQNYASIDGLAYRLDGKVIVNKKEHFIENVDNIPFPDYDLIHIKDYYYDTSGWFNPKNIPINMPFYILSSRSCPRRCTYCTMFMAQGPKYRKRSARNVVDEIEFLYNKYNHRYFSFVDDNFTLDKKRALEICDEIMARKLDIQFDAPNGLEINTLDEEVLKALVNAGMVKACLAIESGSPMIRESVHKRIKQEKIYEVFNIINNMPNLIYNAFFVIGFPNETAETLEETYQLIKGLRLKSAVLCFATPFPGTEFYDECIKSHQSLAF